MVHLLTQSPVDALRYPLAHRWDNFVRAHYQKYQYLIDAQTYQLQRVQRYLLHSKYPRSYHRDTLRLNVLKAKQNVGQVTQQQVDLYKNINPNVACDFKRTFSSSWNIPWMGLGLGGAILGLTTLANSTMPTRFVMFVVPVFIDYLRIANDYGSQFRSLQFLEWVAGYRKAAAFNEKYAGQFKSKQLKKLIGNDSVGVITAGKRLISLASS